MSTNFYLRPLCKPHTHMKHVYKTSMLVLIGAVAALIAYNMLSLLSPACRSIALDGTAKPCVLSMSAAEGFATLIGLAFVFHYVQKLPVTK